MSVIQHDTIIVQWRGPYTYEQLEANLELGQGSGLYLISGKVKYQKTDAEIKYCGITERGFLKRFNDENHKLWDIKREQQIWLGTILTPEPTRTYLERAEALIIYFWQPELNTRKKVTPPRPTTVINYWLKEDGTPRYRQHSLTKELSDVLSWDGTYWRTGNLSVYEDN